jgi:hypothetical protein
MTLDIEKLYQERMDALEPWERVERSVAMFCWVRENMARQITKEMGPMSERRLKLEVARRQYSAEPQIVAWIDQLLADVPH